MRGTWRNRLVSWLGCAGVLILVASSGNAAEKPNVLFVIADDLNTSLGCYGDPLVKSPNIDRLAARGVRFDRAYCQYSLCSPSRTPFLTGLRPDHNGVVNNSTRFRETVPDHVTLPQMFRKAGWFTARVGKVFHYAVPLQIGTDGFDDAASWDHVVNPKGRDVAEEENIFTLNPDAEGASRYAGTLSWLAADGTDAEQTDGMSALAAVELMEKHRDKPFFLAVGFFRPHTPYVAPRSYFDWYPPERIALPEAPPNVRAMFPSPALTLKKIEETMTDDLRRKAIQAYHASTSFMDAQVGVLLDALDRLKLADKTIVVFLSDHGYHLGDKGLWQKLTLFENGARVPLVIAAPGSKSNGRASARIVELLDVYPTLADLCGLKPSVKLDGKSLRPLLEDPLAPWKRPAITQQQRGAPVGTFLTEQQKKAAAKGFMGYTLRTGRWRYTEWDEGKRGVELYDEKEDPAEMRNLAKEERYAETVVQLKALLQKARGSNQ